MKRYIIFISLILLLIVAFRSGDKRKVVFTKEAPPPIGPYSQAIRSGNLLFVSGQIALTSNGTLDTSNIENETRQVLVNLKSILSAGGKSMSDVVKVSIFVTDLRNFQKMNEVYKTFFTNDPPARETIEVNALPKGAHVEISLIAD